jgi:hypothetical protein
MVQASLINEPPALPLRLVVLKVLRACVRTTLVGAVYYSHAPEKEFHHPVSQKLDVDQEPRRSKQHCLRFVRRFSVGGMHNQSYMSWLNGSVAG